MQTNSPLLTDQYELVMAYGYWQLGLAEQEAIFELYFRSNPGKSSFTINCGLQRAIDFLKAFKFSNDDISYLKTLSTPNKKPLFSAEFLTYLSTLKFTCDVDAIAEGTIVFPHEPLLRIKGPILQGQILETALINFLQFSSLIATKAARVCHFAEDDDVIEFGLRRAQGPDGGLIASRSAYIGGCKGTSNVLAGKMYGIPVYGTQAHSWVMAFKDELTAFKNFVALFADNAVILVDTYETVQGVKNAITVASELKQRGQDLLAIRLDSGNLIKLSKKARKLLDDAGFKHTKIMASGDIDETVIKKLKDAKAPIDMWGVGTKLVTAADQPYLNVVYKLMAIRQENQWQYKMKISDDPGKATLPGIHQIRRYYQNEKILGDVIYDLNSGITDKAPKKMTRHEDLLIPIFRQGKCVYAEPNIEFIRKNCLHQRKQFSEKMAENYSVKLDAKVKKLILHLCKKPPE